MAKKTTTTTTKTNQRIFCIKKTGYEKQHPESNETIVVVVNNEQNGFGFFLRLLYAINESKKKNKTKQIVLPKKEKQ